MTKVTINDLTIINQAERTNRLFTGSFNDQFENDEGEKCYWDEMSANAKDKEGNEYKVVWHHLQVVGQEVDDDCWDWENPGSIELI